MTKEIDHTPISFDDITDLKEFVKVADHLFNEADRYDNMRRSVMLGPALDEYRKARWNT